MDKLRVAWFSAGVSSAVAVKLCADEIDRVIYTHIDDQHEDTMRFIIDCAEWFGMEVEILRSDKYGSVEETLNAVQYINGPAGAPCTRILKRRVRKQWEADHDDKALVYYWGMDYSEKDRAERIVESMPEQEHRFPLIENGINKEDAHRILQASGVKRPKMYDLGYPNNNCVGCVKGGMGYWNKIRRDFPEVFERRAKMEREIGASCINGVFLDELDPERGRSDGPIVDDCGIMCELLDINDGRRPYAPRSGEVVGKSKKDS